MNIDNGCCIAPRKQLYLGKSLAQGLYVRSTVRAAKKWCCRQGGALKINVSERERGQKLLYPALVGRNQSTHTERGRVAILSSVGHSRYLVGLFVHAILTYTGHPAAWPYQWYSRCV